MSAFSYSIDPLEKMMVSHRDMFEELLRARLYEEVQNVFEEEKYEPWNVMNRKDYDKLVVAFNLHTGLEAHKDDTFQQMLDQYERKTNDEEKLQFPITVPFSIMVPKICKLVKRYIHDYYVFSRNLGHMDTEIRRSLDEVLCGIVGNTLNNVIASSENLSISQTAQISINASFLINSCTFFEQYFLSFVRAIDDIDLFHNDLRAREVFSQIKTTGEEIVFHLINSKVDEFMSDLHTKFDWTPSRAQSHPSDYLDGMIPYLQTTFFCLSFLPKPVTDAVNSVSCRHIAQTLMDALIGVKKYNQIALYNLNMDVKILEEYAHNSSVPDLVACFSQLRQFLDLMLSGDIEQILDEPVRAERFPALTYQVLSQMLQHYKNLPMMAKPPNNLVIVKKKTIDNIIRRLR